MARGALIAALILTAALVSARHGAASPASASDEVIALEAKWITAMLNGDRVTLEGIFSRDFKHVLADGSVLDRSQELATITKEPFHIKLSHQTVDLDAGGDAAVLHGIDTITQPGKPTRFQRWTDVFFKENGTWMAVSAQENPFSP